MPLHFSSCTFSYRADEPVLRSLDVEFPTGCTVLLGPNGAGKSTTLSLGASVRLPRSGRVTLSELDSARRRDRKEYRRKVGWLPQDVAPVPGLTVREQIAYAGWAKGLSRRDAWDRSVSALEKVRLGELCDRRSHQLSGGQLRRLGIAQCLVHDAEVLLLDEPTAGLDPIQRGVFRELLAELRSSADFIISTHQTEDLADIYDTVMVMDRGEVVFRGDVQNFLTLAPEGTEAGRRLESAYRGLVSGEV